MNIPFNNANYTNSPYGQTNGFNPSVFNSANHGSLDFNPQQQQNALLQQRFGENHHRQQSPSFQNQAFNVNSVVPAKRSRPGNDDGSGASPRPMPGPVGSRSQTPQQPNQPSPFPGNMSLNHYQHLQNNPANGASPSPRPPNNAFNPAMTPNHLNVRSPGSSNSHMPPGNLYQTPQGRLNMSQPGFNPSMGRVNPGNNMPGGQNMSPEAMREAAQQRYRMQIDIQQRQMQAQVNHGGLQNRMSTSTMGQQQGAPNMANTTPQMNQANRPMGPQQAQQYEQQFMVSLHKFLGARGQTLEPDPKVSGRPVNYLQLFTHVTSKSALNGGVNINNWGVVAGLMGLPQNQYPSAPDDLEGIFSRNLKGFVQHWLQSMHKRKIQQQQTAVGMGPGRAFPQGSPTNTQHLPQPPQSVRQPPGTDQSPQQLQQAPGFILQRPPGMRPPSPVQNNILQQPEVVDRDGMSRASSHPASNQSPIKADHVAGQRPSLDRRTQSNDPNPDVASAEVAKQEQMTPSNKPNDEIYHPRKRVFRVKEDRKLPDDRETEKVPDEYWGGLPIDILGATVGRQLARVQPGVPFWQEMGAVDIHALTMSIRSGFHGEMRYALDHLVGLSHDTRVNFALEDCEGLLEALIECGEDQLDLLSESCPAVDGLEYPNFEQLSKASRKESQDLRSDPTFASSDYKLDHAVDRLIAITTILRNMSIPDLLKNHDMLLQVCVKFVATAIRTVGNRPKLLRTNRNLVDFMKDLVTFLANLSHRLEIPSKDDANALLHFLASFAPERSPYIKKDTGRLTFQPYDPRKHQYLPSAIDALAKLFARDEPNRSLYKSLLSEDQPTTSDGIPLLTRAFALAVAPIPDRLSPHLASDPRELVRIAQERNHFFTQGMLAGDILSTLIPSSDTKTAQSWLDAEDGWAPSLMHLLTQLGFGYNMVQMRQHHGRADDFEAASCSLISQRGFSMLKRLSERVDKRELSGDALLDVRLDRQVTLKALSHPNYEVGTLRNLVAFASLDG